MFRHEALRPLSRGHQRVLFHARELRRHGRGALPAFLAYAQTELVRHLDAEERVLLPVVARRVPADHPDLVRARSLHGALRDLAAATDAGATDESLRTLAAALHDHARDAERCLFPLAERELGPAGLAEVARALGDAYVV